MVGLRQRFVHDLERMDLGHHDGLLIDQAGLNEQGHLQVCIATLPAMRSAVSWTAASIGETLRTAGSNRRMAAGGLGAVLP